MKRFVLHSLLLLTLACSYAWSQTAAANAPSAQSKEELLATMDQTRDKFLASVAHVSDAQWNYKPAPNRWSIAECAEHIVLSERFFNEQASAAMKAEPDPAVKLPAPAGAVDATIEKRVADRSQKATAPDFLTPKGTFKTKADAIQAFKEARARNRAFVANTDEAAMRGHIGKGPLGPVDVHEVMLLMATHSGRHTAQIEEVKADANYPKQ